MHVGLGMVSAAGAASQLSTSATVETPARDQPIASAIGRRNTVSEVIAPNPTQVSTILTPTMIQP
jgi:hypothetical protein